MIPKIIHYCWFGHSPLPELAQKCIDSWHQHMPDYEYRLWNEDNFDVHCNAYVKEAYESGKYAFVTDYVRLFADSLPASAKTCHAAYILEAFPYGSFGDAEFMPHPGEYTWDGGGSRR